MSDNKRSPNLVQRAADANLGADEFRECGHALVDRIAGFLESLPDRALTSGESASKIRDLVGQRGLPTHGQPPAELLDETATLLFDHSLHNGHPMFLGYITSSAAPLGALADLLAAAVNPNLGKWELSPVASEIEAQTVRWIAELIGYPQPCGGLMVSGGNMANFLGFIAARRARATWDIRKQGVYGDEGRLTAYVSRETHTWIEKAADVSGIGTDAIRWIETDAQQRLDVEALEHRISADREQGCLPFIVIGTAGNVSTGAVDPLSDIAALAREHSLWFHVDGAYGAPAAALPEAPAELRALAQADSVALDPHKWLYAPLEAACTLVRDRQTLVNAFSFHPPYYHFDSGDPEPRDDFYELGFQNSRGFRALKVWLGLRHVGREGYIQMLRDDIALAEKLFQAADQHAELEAHSHHLSITTFRFVPANLSLSEDSAEAYLNGLNQCLLDRVQKGGKAFVSNAIIGDRYLLRACVVNFRTQASDIDQLIEIVVGIGRVLDAERRPASLG